MSVLDAGGREKASHPGGETTTVVYGPDGRSLLNATALSVIGRASNSSGDTGDIAATASTYTYLGPHGGTNLSFDKVHPLGISFHGWSVYHNTTQSMATSGTWYARSNNSENFDTDGYHSTSSDTSRATIPSGLGGYYSVGATCSYATNATGSRRFNIEKNSNGTQGSGTILASINATNAGAGASTTLNNAVPVLLAAGDVIEVFVMQESGGALNLNGNTYFPFWGYLVGV